MPKKPSPNLPRPLPEVEPTPMMDADFPTLFYSRERGHCIVIKDKSELEREAPEIFKIFFS